ncbi:MAG: ATP-binding protein [Candidatus Lernaella stagnicola]|nr:ATP-binding protein [Candidatus Lernaella stagnicola]
MEEICHHIMDLAENSTAAGASLVEIVIIEDEKDDWLTIEIQDNGRGFNNQVRDELNGPISKCSSCGIGLTLFSRACEEAAGKMEVTDSEAGGALVRGSMRLSHEDSKPLGDVNETLITLIMGSPGVNWVFRHEKIHADGTTVKLFLDTQKMREEVGGVPLAHPEAIRRIRVSLRQQQATLNE